MPVARTQRLPMLLALLLLVAGTVLATIALPQTPAFAATDAGAESEFVQLINGERANRGLPQLRVASDLVGVARDHSKDMAASGHLHHNPNLGQDVSNWQRVSENVGVGWSVPSLHSAFMDSSGHRANILDDKVTEIGVGVEVEEDGRIWVTQVFRLPAGASEPAPEPEPEPEPEPTVEPDAGSDAGAADSEEPAPKAQPSAAPPEESGTGTSAENGTAVESEAKQREIRIQVLPHGPWSSTSRSVR